jgi:predicted nuclease with TOPRIM domain
MLKSKMTIEKLAEKMDNAFIGVHKKINVGFTEVHRTIEDLALMTQRGFESVDRRFEAVEVRLDRVEGRLDRIEGRLDAIEMELSDIKKRLREMPTMQEFELLKERVSRLEKELAQARKLKSA